MSNASVLFYELPGVSRQSIPGGWPGRCSKQRRDNMTNDELLAALETRFCWPEGMAEDVVELLRELGIWKVKEE